MRKGCQKTGQLLTNRYPLTHTHTHTHHTRTHAHTLYLCVCVYIYILHMCVCIYTYIYNTYREGNGTPLQYSCLENPMDGGACWAAVHGVTKSRTRLSDFTFMHWRRKWQPTPVFLPGESQGRGRLVGCHLWGRTESDTTEAT